MGDGMAPPTYLYVGGYTNESPIGIHVYDSSDATGRLVKLSEVEGVEHPSFLAAHPSRNVLYAVSETTSPEGGGLVAFGVDPVDGSLGIIDRAPSHGSAPCYVSVDADGRHLYVANYVSGTIAVFALEGDGRFGELVAAHQHRGSGPSARQEGPHTHCILPGPTAGSVYAADLGTDEVCHYVHDRRQGVDSFTLRDQLAFEPGAGPRHLAFHPEHHLAFVVCELDSTIVTLGVDPMDGRLTRLRSTSTLPDDFVGESIAAEIRVHPDGRFVYVSNRGHDSIAVFGIAGAGEPLEPLGHVSSGGQTPRGFAIHPSGRALLVANQDTKTIVPFEIDAATGVPHQRDVTHPASEPVCLAFLEVVR